MSLLACDELDSSMAMHWLGSISSGESAMTMLLSTALAVLKRVWVRLLLFLGMKPTM